MWIFVALYKLIQFTQLIFWVSVITAMYFMAKREIKKYGNK